MKVACIVDDLVSAFELGVACEVFGDDRTAYGVPAFDFRVVAPTPGRIEVERRHGFALDVEHDLAFVDGADIVVVPAFRDCARDTCGTAVLDAIRRAHERGAWILSLCTGAFVLARAGLLDGRRATTHWRHADRLQDEFPEVDVACDALYVEEGRVITSAGIVLAAVFAALGVLPLVTLGQLGLIVGIGVLVDTLVVCTVIVPAIFSLVGDRIWLPGKLTRVPVKREN